MKHPKIIMILGLVLFGYSLFTYKEAITPEQKQTKNIISVVGALLTFVGYFLSGGKD